MVELPRLALGTLQPRADITAIGWALLESLGRRQLRVQHFLSHAYFCPRDGATAITGLPARHLDSWLMTPEVCREVFVRGCQGSDLALVEGCFSGDSSSATPAGPSPPGDPNPSNFTRLCEWLELPRVAVIDTQQLTPCHLPERPADLDGLLLDNVPNASEASRLQTLFESLWKVPLLGYLPRLDALREKIQQVSCGDRPASELCKALGDAFTTNAQIQTLVELAASKPFRFEPIPDRDPTARASAAGLRVAVAYDDCFRGYFPDTLDLLESRGATIVDFSPLHDECLPPHTDIVYVGCGHPELHARQLAENDCLMLSLKSHVSTGGRIYAECGGLAYLAQELALPDGNRWPMVGILPSTVEYIPTSGPPVPTELHLAEDNWLGSAGQSWRGYLSQRWYLHPAEHLQACAVESDHQCDVVRSHQAIGSRVHLNFAAQGDLLRHFFAPAHPGHPPGSEPPSRTSPIRPAPFGSSSSG